MQITMKCAIYYNMQLHIMPNWATCHNTQTHIAAKCATRLYVPLNMFANWAIQYIMLVYMTTNRNNRLCVAMTMTTKCNICLYAKLQYIPNENKYCKLRFL